MSLSFEQKLQNYAELAVKVGVGLRAGQRLIVRAPVESAPLVRLIAASAYKAGARLVDVLWNDDALTLARFQYAPRDSFEEFPTWQVQALREVLEHSGATLRIHAEDPDLLQAQDPDLVDLVERTGQKHFAPVRQLGMANLINWSVISAPTAGWANKIFPGAEPAAQINQLWDLIFEVCRVNQADPVAAWQQHAQNLAAKTTRLNARQYAALKYTAPGTDLTLGLPEGHIWHGVEAQTPGGITFIPNLPTEEVFTMPHKDKTEGVVSSTKPLSYAGVLITNFSLTFAGGRIVKVSAETGETTLKKLVETDEGAARLGEVALVPHSSPLSQTGVLFYNSLYDENASCHLALGKAYPFCLAGGTAMSEAELAAAGVNHSFTHEDFMIGSAALNVDGLTRDGLTEPIMRAGEWAF